MSDFDRYKVMKAKRMVSATEKQVVIHADNISFILAVYYKLMRAKNQFEHACKCPLYISLPYLPC